MKKLTMSRARQLIERELGIKAKELTAPESMNGNPEFPWYELHIGNQIIEVSTSGYGAYSKGNEVVRLSVTHENSLSYVSEYFYADNLEYCDEYTQKEKIGITNNGPKYRRLDADASDAVFRHYHQPKQRVEQKAEADQPAERFQKEFVLACRFLSDTIGCPKIYAEDVDIPDCTLDGGNCERKNQWECWQSYLLDSVSNEQVCRICGCTQENACPGGCWWVEEDLCSSCCETSKSQSTS